MPKGPKPSAAGAAERRGIQSVEVSARILGALAAADGPAQLSAVSGAVGMPPSQVHRYLASFIRAGLVRQDEATGRYDLGPVALEIGLAALSRLDVVERAASAMPALTLDTGLTSLLSVWSNQGPTIVRWQRAPIAFVTSLSLGSVLPVLRSATGQVFLAYLPEAVTAAAVEREGGGGDRSAVVERVRSAGVGRVDGTAIPGLRALAAPILDMQGDASAVITLIGTEDVLARSDEATADTLKAFCRSLSLA